MTTFDAPKIYEIASVFYDMLTAGKARRTKEDL
jgi:hypothetical protein